MVKTILSQLIFNGEYFMRVWPYLKDDYFDKGAAKTIYKMIGNHFNEYKTIPTANALMIALERKSINQIEFDQTKEFLESVRNVPEDLSWLVKETEKYCQEQAGYIATSKVIEIQENAARPPEERDPKIPELGAIIDLMRDVICITFDNSVGHDWFEDYAARFVLYQTKANKVPFLIDILNKITKGGAELGTLNVILMGVNVGKSLGLCTLAADYMKSGHDVLYISMEMAEHVVAKRIDANLLDVTMDELDDGMITYPEYKARIENLAKKTTLGKLKIKQYPTGGASVNNFRALMNDLKIKQKFVPKVVIVDYLGICASSRIKGGTENSYALVKAIAEELRGFAIEYQVVLWTGAQTTRGAWDSSDINMSDVAESAGLPATADFMLAGVETEELAQLGVQMFKQIKSRYGDKNYINKFNLGVKKGNQRWYSVSQSWEDAKEAEGTTVEKAIGKSNQQAYNNSREKLDNLAEKLAQFTL